METEVQKATQRLQSISEVIENYMVTMLLNWHTIWISKILFMYWNQYKSNQFDAGHVQQSWLLLSGFLDRLCTDKETFISLSLQLAHYNLITCSDMQWGRWAGKAVGDINNSWHFVTGTWHNGLRKETGWTPPAEASSESMVTP
jgi:hypothetical protein